MRGGRAWVALIGVCMLAALPLAPSTGAAPGEEPMVLSPATIDVRSHGVTPDGTMAVFTTQSGLGSQLRSVPIDGGPTVDLTGIVPEFLTWSPGATGTTVILHDGTDLFVGPADGAGLANLTATFAPRVASDATQTPDGSHVLFRAREDGPWALFAVESSGGDPFALSQETEGALGNYALSPDGTTVVYSVSAAGGRSEIYVRDVAATTPARLLISGAGSEWKLSPDGLWVVFSRNSSVVPLEAVPVAGGDPVSLSDTLQFGALEDFSITEDSSRVVFQYYSAMRRIYSAPIAGGLPVLEAEPPDRGIMDTAYAVTPDGQWLAYSGAAMPGLGSRAFTTRLGAASADVVEHTVGLAGGSVIQLVVTPDSSTVVFSSFRAGESDEVWASPVSGGDRTLLSEGYAGSTLMPLDHNARGLELSPDGRHVLYRTNPAVGGEHLMYAPVAGGDPVSLISTRAGMGYFEGPMITPDGDHLLVATTTALPGQPLFSRLVAVDLTPDPPSAELRVTTDPPLPATIIVDGVARNSWGLTWAELGPGFRQVCFGGVAGWEAPPCVNLAVGGVTEVQGTYTQRGSLRVVTEPAVPSTISVDGVPRNDWGMWLDIEPGQHEVCFGDVRGFAPPECELVSVNPGELSTVVGTFTPDGSDATVEDGLLRVTTNPPVAARIIVDDVPRDRWGLAWLKLRQGIHEVCFDEAPGFSPPPCQDVVVVAGSTTTVVGEMEELGQLRVVTTPPAAGTIHVDGIARDDWGVWFDVPPGSYEVCFERVSGQQPACETTSVDPGVLTTVEGSYAQPSP